MVHTVKTSTLYAPGTELRSSKNEAFQDSLYGPRPPKINTLPIELLSEIFNLIVYENEVDHKLSSAPMILAHVCSHWRSVAFGTTSLWTTISFGLRSNIERAKFGLKFSGLRPVDFHLDFRDRLWNWIDGPHRIKPKQMQELISLMADNDNYLRWRTVEIITDIWQPLHAFLDRTSSMPSLPRLERLELSRRDSHYNLHGGVFRSDGLVVKEPIKLFGGCATTPNLRHVSLIGIHMDWTAAPNVLKNLMVLDIRYLTSDVAPTMDEFLSVMRASPNMEEFILLGCIPTIADDPLSISSSDICLFLPCLREFRFGWVDVEQAVQLLCIFQLPALEELVLEVIPSSLHDISDSSAVLETLIKFNLTPSVRDPAEALYSLSRLQKFTMHSLDVRPAIFLSFLAKIGNIEEIQILGNADVDLVDPFAFDPVSLCTKLQKLTVEFPEDVAHSMDSTLSRIKFARPTVLVFPVEWEVLTIPADPVGTSHIDSDGGQEDE